MLTYRIKRNGDSSKHRYALLLGLCPMAGFTYPGYTSHDVGHAGPSQEGEKKGGERSSNWRQKGRDASQSGKCLPPLHC